MLGTIGLFPTQLPNLRVLVPSGSLLTGSIPDTLSDNDFDGELPSGLDRLENLTNFLLNNNSFSGTLPPEIGNLSNLIILSVFDNMITAGLPAEIEKLQSLSVLYLYGKPGVWEAHRWS
ncbi:hypothetical protein U1Q18_004545 [Sarracenia purpurea var. burkii]